MIKKIKVRKGTKLGFIGSHGVWVGNKRPEFFMTSRALSSKGKRLITAKVRISGKNYYRVGKPHKTTWSHLR